MSDDRPAARVVCDEHHWVSRHQPGLPLYWIDQCSLCGDFNAERMAEQIANVREPSDDGNDGGTVAVNDDGLRARIEALCDRPTVHFTRFLEDAARTRYYVQYVSVEDVRAALAGDPETGQT